MKFDVRLAMVAVLVVMVFGLAGPSRSSLAANPTAEQALKLTPIQEGVDCDRPTPEEAAKCKIFARKIDGHVGWVVESPRRHDPAEVPRYQRRQHRRSVELLQGRRGGLSRERSDLHRQGGPVPLAEHGRHPLGRREMAKREPGSRPTGKNIAWRVISPEEVTAEVVAALAKQDVERFNRLLLTPEELQSLGLAKAKADALAAKLARAEDDFKALLAHPGAITRQSKWVQFGGTKPGVVPADGAGPSRDLSVYENVFAVVETGGKHSQVQIGTLVRIGDAWRLIDSPAHRAGGPGGNAADGLLLPGFAGQSPRGGRRGGRRSDAETHGRTGEARPIRSPPRRPLGADRRVGQDGRRAHHVVSPTGRHDQRRGPVGQGARGRQAAGVAVQ